MAIKICVFALIAFIALVSSAPHHEHDYHSPAHYEFHYSVHDGHTGDVKEQKESRKGDDVKGYYSLNEPDGTKRIVHYTASKEHGFEAIVTHEGHPIHHHDDHSSHHHDDHSSHHHHADSHHDDHHHAHPVYHHKYSIHHPIHHHDDHHDDHSHHAAHSHVSYHGPHFAYHH